MPLLWQEVGVKMGYYRAEIYKESIISNSFIAGSVEVLKMKAEPYIRDDKVT